MKKKPISEQRVVITGASSGIGRETALQLAAGGAQVVAAARTESKLNSLAQEAASSPGRIHAVPTDVSDWSQVEKLASTAVERMGGIDTWINNAAVSMYATVEQAEVDEMRRIIEVNLLGQIHGVKAALPHLRQAGGGTIINVSSIVGRRAVPLQAAYVASKHAIRGFTDALRMEQEHEESGITVTTILPGSTNTPLFDNARAKLGGAKPMPIPPIYEPGAVAQAILHAVEHPAREIVVGAMGAMFVLGERISPELMDRYMVQGGRMFRQQISDQRDNNADNLFQPLESTGTVHGSFGQRTFKSSLYTRIFEEHPWTKRVVLAATLVGTTTVFRAVGWKSVRTLLASKLLAGL